MHISFFIEIHKSWKVNERLDPNSTICGMYILYSICEWQRCISSLNLSVCFPISKNIIHKHLQSDDAPGVCFFPVYIFMVFHTEIHSVGRLVFHFQNGIDAECCLYEMKTLSHMIPVRIQWLGNGTWKTSVHFSLIFLFYFFGEMWMYQMLNVYPHQNINFPNLPQLIIHLHRKFSQFLFRGFSPMPKLVIMLYIHVLSIIFRLQKLHVHGLEVIVAENRKLCWCRLFGCIIHSIHSQSMAWPA